MMPDQSDDPMFNIRYTKKHAGKPGHNEYGVPLHACHGVRQDEHVAVWRRVTYGFLWFPTALTPEEKAAYNQGVRDAYNQGVRDAAAVMAPHPMWMAVILKLLKGSYETKPTA